MLVVSARRGLPPLFERAARYAVPTAFAALAVGSLVSSSTGGVAVAPMAAVMFAAVAVRRTGSSYMALVVGMPTLWIATMAVPR
jgi:branched-subunit amino acid transport protein